MTGRSHREQDLLKAPFPWFGGKSRVAGLVWQRFGDVPNFVEPFFGSGAVLFGRPASHKHNLETANDKDGYVCNVWRSIQHDPEQVAVYADWPANEIDQNARHAWLVKQKKTLVQRLEGDPNFYDAKIAGWWCWGISLWLGSGFCSGEGPWIVVDGKMVKRTPNNCQENIRKQIIRTGNSGPGVFGKRIYLGGKGLGVFKQRISIGDKGQGVHKPIETENLIKWFYTLSKRLRRVRVCCGDWTRVLTECPTTQNGLTGIFLDPPYSVKDRDDCYNEDDRSIAKKVCDWALEHGSQRDMRIALCGYEGEHKIPKDWEEIKWTAVSSHASSKSKNTNRYRERIWFSPHCLRGHIVKTLF